MKPYCIAAICLLLFAFCSLTLGQSSHEPEKCCFGYINAKIPAAIVERFETTSPACKMPGVIFHTNRQLERCANPAEKWVQRLMGIVKNRMLNVSTPPAASGDSTQVAN
ncbi:C-C motif chemokine 4-like [Astyanax mexicanus]|uniref:C-C motif chemokine n=2 Tax=Astyanax mexicanus TaxID=7994 RepID=A0A3B1KBM5_ASTMX|nr:C-C motif chemokine 4-like [Astyanax mexicanus]